MALLGAGDTVGLERLANTKSGGGKPAEVGKKLIQGLIAYKEQDYLQAVNYLLPLVDETRPLYAAFTDIGGSNAQRDVFSQIFLLSLGHSKQQGDHKQLLERLLWQRTAIRPSPLTNRFINRLLVSD